VRTARALTPALAVQEIVATMKNIIAGLSLVCLLASISIATAESGNVVVEDSTVKVNAGSLELVVPAGFERFLGKPTVPGQYAYARPYRKGGIAALIQVTYIDHKALRGTNEADAREAYTEVLIDRLSQMHQKFSSQPPQIVHADALDLLVTRWDGSQGKNSFSGFLAVGILGDKIVLGSTQDLRVNFDKYLLAYQSSIKSLRAASSP